MEKHGEQKYNETTKLGSFFHRITTDRIKLLNPPETLDFLNLYEVFLNWGCAFFYNTLSPPTGGEFAVGDKVL
jgi:hypothetical protein